MKQRVYILIALLLTFLSGCSSSNEMPPINEASSSAITAKNDVDSNVETNAPADVALKDSQKEAVQDNSSQSQATNKSDTADTKEQTSKNAREYYSPEEYAKAVATASQLSATPKTAVTKNVFTAHQAIETYNTNEHRDLVMDINGNIIKDCGMNAKLHEESSQVVIGNFVFLNVDKEKREYYIFAPDGEHVNTFSLGSDRTIHVIADLGNEYYIFIARGSNGWYGTFILHPDGQYYNLDLTRDAVVTNYKKDIYVGKLSEGVFAYLADTLDTYAFYFNIDGTIAIDLSEESTNYSVIEMNDFKDGQARIRIKGANGNYYYVRIDKEGNFLSTPNGM